MNNQDISPRTLTVVIQFDNNNHRPDWIWDCHKNQSYQNGIFITAIAEGDLVRTNEDE